MDANNVSGARDEPSLRSERHVSPQCLDWQDKSYRDAYMGEAIDQGIAWQIKINRERRDLSQEQLAEMLGTGHSAVSQLEDPDRGGHDLETLKAVARAFDCALLVQLVPYATLASESERLSPEDLYAAPFHFPA
jgi:ribosome-binding protein aMBF1 (putative translation factor)